MTKTTGNKPIVKYECKDVVLYEKKKIMSLRDRYR